MWLSRVVMKAKSRKGSDSTKIMPTTTKAKMGLLAPIKASPAARLTKITSSQTMIWA
jgi:hypothetical protein